MKSFMFAVVVIVLTAWGGSVLLSRYQVDASAKFATSSVRLGAEN